MKKKLILIGLVFLSLFSCQKNETNESKKSYYDQQVLTSIKQADSEFKEALKNDSTYDLSLVAKSAIKSYSAKTNSVNNYDEVFQNEKFQKSIYFVNRIMNSESNLKSASTPEIDSLIDILDISQLEEEYHLKMKNVYLDEKYNKILAREDSIISPETQIILINTSISDIDSILTLANNDVRLTQDEKKSVYLTYCVMRTHIETSLIADLQISMASQSHLKGWFSVFIRSVVKVFVATVVTGIGTVVCTGAGPAYPACVGAFYIAGEALANYADQKYMKPRYPDGDDPRYKLTPKW